MTILVGVADENTPTGKSMKVLLSEMAANAKIDQFVMIGDMNKHTFAKLAGFISQSVSSTSQALNTGGPSVPINPVSVDPIDLDGI